MFLTSSRKPSAWEALRAAKDWYFSQHPDFRPGDENENYINDLIQKHLGGPQNAGELEGLVGAMENEPLYKQYLDRCWYEYLRQKFLYQQQQLLSRRSRSRSRSPRSKAVAKTGRLLPPPTAAMAKRALPPPSFKAVANYGKLVSEKRL